MKNALTIIALIVGIGIGYFFKTPSIENIKYDTFVTLITSDVGNNFLIEYLSSKSTVATPVTKSEAKDFITSLYKNETKDKCVDKIKNTINPSYIFDLAPIVARGLTMKIKPLEMKMRIFPADRENKLTFVLGLEDNDSLRTRDLGLFEFISPCPPKCPKNQGDQKKFDFITNQEWINLYLNAFSGRDSLRFEN
jgi:hypothetical protein